MSDARPPMQSILSRLLAWCYAAWAWLVFGVLILLFFLLAAPRRRSTARRLARRIARWMFHLVGIPLQAEGLDRLPHRPHILVINHSSFLDAIALTALLPADPGHTFTTRQELRAQAVLCPLVNSVGALVLRPHGKRYGVNVELFRRALRRGDRLAIFPEGRFRTEPGLLAFHSGAFAAAAIAGVPVVVAALQGAREALPMGSWRLRRSPIRLRIGAVLQASQHDPNAARRLRDAARQAMLPLTGEGDATSGVVSPDVEGEVQA